MERSAAAFPLEFRDRFSVRLKPISERFAFADRLIGGTERFVEFRHAGEGGEQKKNGKINALGKKNSLKIL